MTMRSLRDCLSGSVAPYFRCCLGGRVLFCALYFTTLVHTTCGYVRLWSEVYHHTPHKHVLCGCLVSFLVSYEVKVVVVDSIVKSDTISGTSSLHVRLSFD